MVPIATVAAMILSKIDENPIDIDAQSQRRGVMLDTFRSTGIVNLGGDWITVVPLSLSRNVIDHDDTDRHFPMPSVSSTASCRSKAGRKSK